MISIRLSLFTSSMLILTDVVKDMLNLKIFLVTLLVTATTSFIFGDLTRSKRYTDQNVDQIQTKLKNSSATLHQIFVETFPCNTSNLKRDVFAAKEDLFKCIKNIDDQKMAKKRILVTGGAGFVGSHLVDVLMLKGHKITVIDNFYTGRKKNVEHWFGHDNFDLIECDVIECNLPTMYDQIYHLASPASPIHYMADPIKTIKTITLGTLRTLELAKTQGIRIVIASTSEIYGDPQVHPQIESYWGNANPVGPRSCYDESKRLSESLAVAYREQHNVSIGIARIFNTYGPRMHPDDGRVVSNFVSQTITEKPITIYGTGNQTRSFQYVSDLVEGLQRLMESNISTPVNLGNPDEITINLLADKIKQNLINSGSKTIFHKLPIDDPIRRRPDIRKAAKLLNWRPVVPLNDGLHRTIQYFLKELDSGS